MYFSTPCISLLNVDLWKCNTHVMPHIQNSMCIKGSHLHWCESAKMCSFSLSTDLFTFQNFAFLNWSSVVEIAQCHVSYKTWCVVGEHNWICVNYQRWWQTSYVGNLVDNYVRIDCGVNPVSLYSKLQYLKNIKNPRNTSSLTRNIYIIPKHSSLVTPNRQCVIASHWTLFPLTQNYRIWKTSRTHEIHRPWDKIYIPKHSE
jgi:hypothetical protein